MTVDLNQAVIVAFLAFCRIGGCFLLMPGLSSVRVPLQVRLFVAFAATAAVVLQIWESLAPLAGSEATALAAMIVSETLTGALIGLIARFYVLALQFAGSAIAMMTGYGGMLGSAIEEPEPQAPIAALISFSALMMLFIFDFHHHIIRALVASYTVAPPSLFFNPASALADVTDTLAEAFAVMIRLGSPFLAYAIVVNLGIGLVNKLTPQIPIYFISLPFVLTGGLILLYFGVANMLSLFADGFLPVTVGR